MTNVKTPMSILLLSSIGLLAACDDTKSDDYRPTPDNPQTQTYRGQAASSGTQYVRADGSADLSSAAMVEVWSMSDSGETTYMGEGSIEADGTFEVTIEDDSDSDSYAILHAVDASGELIASAVVEGTDASDEFMSRIDVESTVEAWAFLDRVEDEGDADSTNYVDIRSRVDASLALSLIHI